MITVGYSSREHKPEFIEYLKKSSGYKKINVIEKINNGEKSLAQVYNEILKESETDIIVFCHDDIYFDTNSLNISKKPTMVLSVWQEQHLCPRVENGGRIEEK
jgi:glycosyltransferase involved in cell wall biosynthesis